MPVFGLLRGGNKNPVDILNASHLPSAATAAVVTLPAVANAKNCIGKVYWSYDAAPAAGAKLTITGSGITFEISITAAGPGAFTMGPYVGVVNTPVVATLSSGGGVVVGKLNVDYVVERF